MSLTRGFTYLIRLTVMGFTLSMVLGGLQNTFAEDRVRLNFGVYSSNKPTAMVRTFKPILNALETSMAEKLGTDVDIRMQIAKDYEQGIADLTNGKVDFSRFGPASYIEAKRENKHLEILAMENVKGDKVFYGIIAVHKNSPILSIQDLKDRTFAFGAQSSTIGRYLSQLFLENNGISSHDLLKFEYLGRHDKVGTAVGAGDFDAGALNESTFKKLVASGEPIRELARFPNVTKPWIARRGLKPEVFKALQESLWELKDEKKLKSLKVVGFLPGSDDDYQTIRNAMENNDLFFKMPAKEPTTGAANIDVQNSSQQIPSNFDALQTNSIQINITLPINASAGSTSARDGAEPVVVNVLINGEPVKNSEYVVNRVQKKGGPQ